MTYKILLHGGISGRGSNRCRSGGGSRSRSTVSSRGGLEVVAHLGIELSYGLLDRTGVAATTLLTSGALLTGGTLLVLLVLGSSRLRLSLGLGSTLRKSLDGGDNLIGLSSANNNLNLLWLVLVPICKVYDSKRTLIGRLSTRRPLRVWKALLAPSGLWKMTLAMPRDCELGP